MKLLNVKAMHGFRHNTLNTQELLQHKSITQYRALSMITQAQLQSDNMPQTFIAEDSVLVDKPTLFTPVY